MTVNWRKQVEYFVSSTTSTVALFADSNVQSVWRKVIRQEVGLFFGGPRPILTQDNLNFENNLDLSALRHVSPDNS